MHREVIERYKALHDMRASGKSLQEVANAFHISAQRVRQIITNYEHFIKTEREMQESHDPLQKALGNGRISRKVYNSIVRGGYGKAFDFDNLLSKLRSNTFNPKDFPHFGNKSLDQLRHAFLNQDEINAINNSEG
jgi:hypothetical protein